ncbi:FAR1 DNA-binding domain [Sesbania bispinosa]|nr:FAR1 DNA-binding domain [Sesbania bispinosa]
MDGAIEINQGNNILSLELQQALEAPFDLNEAPFDLNELPLEEENLSNGLDTIFEPLEEENPSNASNIIFEPFVGQCFSNEEKALEFYQRYAKQHGFSVLKARFDKNKNGEVRRRDFFCHRAGRQPLKIVYPSKDQRHRSSARSDFKAHMRIKLKKYVDIFPDEWHVVEFIAEHNHELLSEEEERFLRSHRTITKEDENRILLLKDAGLCVPQIMRVMELEKNVKHGYLSFIPKDVYNLFTKIHNIEGKNGVTDLLCYCQAAKAENLGESKVDWVKKPCMIHWGESVVFSSGAATCRTQRRPLNGITMTWQCSDEREGTMDHVTQLGEAHRQSALLGEVRDEDDLLRLVNYGECMVAEEEILHNSMQPVTIAFHKGRRKGVDLAIEDIEHKQLHATMLDKYRGSSLRTLSPLEHQAQDILTPFAFKKFQEEFSRATQYFVFLDGTTDFMVQYYKEGETQKHKVHWDKQVATCSWPLLVDEENGEDNNEIEMIDLLQCPPKSKTKGRPKQKSLRGGKELSINKQVKKCRLCKHPGHNFTTCPDKENMDGVSNSEGGPTMTLSLSSTLPCLCRPSKLSHWYVPEKKSLAIGDAFCRSLIGTSEHVLVGHSGSFIFRSLAGDAGSSIAAQLQV